MTLYTVLGIGLYNFLVGLIDSQDFSISVLQFPGFLLISVGYRLLQLRSLPLTRRTFLTVFFKMLYDPDTGRLNFFNLLNLVVRSICFFGLTWLLIISSHYAIKAGINFGIISTCMSI